METYSSINAYGYHYPYQYDPHSLHWCSRCPSSTEWVLPSYSPPPPHPFPQPYLSTPPPVPYPPFPPPVPELSLPQEVIYAERLDDETNMKVPVSVCLYSDMTADVVFDVIPHCRSMASVAQQANHKPDTLKFEHSTAAAIYSELIPDLDDNDTEEASIDSKPLVIVVGDTKSKIEGQEALSIDSNCTDLEVKWDALFLDCIREIDSTIVPFNTWMDICLQFEKSGVASSLFDRMLDNNGAYSYRLIFENVTTQQMLHHFPFDPGSRARLVFESVALVFDNTPQYLPCTTIGTMSTMEFEKNRMVRIAGQVCLMLLVAKRFTNPDHFIGDNLNHCLHYDPHLRELFEAILWAMRDILYVMRSCVKPKEQTEANPIVLLHDFDNSCLEWRYTRPLLEEDEWESSTVDILRWDLFALDRPPLCDVVPNCDHLYSLWTTDIKRLMAETIIVIRRDIGCLCCAGLHSRHDHNVLQLKCHAVVAGATHCFNIEGYEVDYGTLISSFHSRYPRETQLPQVLDAWIESNPCANYDSWMIYVPTGEFFSRIGLTEFFKDFEKHMELESVKRWRKFLDTIPLRLTALMALPSLSVRGNLDVLVTDAARYKRFLLESSDPMGHQQTLGATKLCRHVSGIIKSMGVKVLFIHTWILVIYNFEKMSAGNLLDLIKINDIIGKYFYELLFCSKDRHFFVWFALAMLFPTLPLSIQQDVAAQVMTTVSVATYGVYSYVEGENLKATVVHDKMDIQGINPNTLIHTSLIHGFYNECKLLEDGFASGAGRTFLKVPPTLIFVINGEMPSYEEQQDMIYSGTMNSNFSNVGDGIHVNTSKLLLVDGADHKDFQFLYQRIVSPVTSRENLDHWSYDFGNNTSMLFASSSALTYFLSSKEKRKTCKHQEFEKGVIACFREISCMEPAPNRVTYRWVILACKFIGLSAKRLHCFELLVQSKLEQEKATTRGSLLRDFGEHIKIKEGDGVYCAIPNLNFTTIVVMVTKTSWQLKGDSNKPAATLDNANFNKSNLWEQVPNNAGTSKHSGLLNFTMLLMSNKCQRNQRCNELIRGAVDHINVLVEKVLAELHGSNLEDKVLFQDGRNVMNLIKIEGPFGKMANYIWDPGKIAYIL